MDQVRCALILLAVVGLVLCPHAIQAQEEEEEPSLESILRGALEDLVEDQTGGQLGRIRRVEVVDKTASEVVLDVQLRGIEDPNRVALAVELYDQQLRVVEGMEIDFDPLPQGDGSTMLRVHFAGDGRVFSSAIQVSLVDETTGRPSSHRKKDLAWEWIGSGDWRPQSGGGDSSSLAPPRGDSGESSEQQREPRIVEVRPQRVPDTPTFSGGAGASEAGGTSVYPRRTPRPPIAHIGKATPTPGIAVLTSMVMVSFPVVDLYKEALHANWSSGAGQLKINDKENANSKGFARLLGKKALYDSKDHEKVIELHPQYTDNGYIRGVYRISFPNKATRFEAVAGFLKGVTRTNGVHLTVSIHASRAGGVSTTMMLPSDKRKEKVIMNRTLTLKDPVARVSAPIPESYWGKSAVLTIRVKANGSSTQDWFALSNPGIY
ncbi:MAG: hypothetical protein GY906_14385 [bacterium]|nr:hypothetical protein [bacterium]